MCAQIKNDLSVYFNSFVVFIRELLIMFFDYRISILIYTPTRIKSSITTQCIWAIHT